MSGKFIQIFCDPGSSLLIYCIHYSCSCMEYDILYNICVILIKDCLELCLWDQHSNSRNVSFRNDISLDELDCMSSIYF